ncbi:MAG: SMR family transporter [Bacteroidia bacterium]
MLSLVITILIFTYFILCFKWFEKFGVDNFSAIIVNNLTAGILGFFLSFGSSMGSVENPQSFYTYALAIGFLFIGVFNLTAFSTQQSGISVTVITSKIASIVIPIAFSFIIGLEKVSTKPVVAIILAICSLFLIINLKGENKLKKIALFILLGIFVGQGASDILFSQSNKFVLDEQKELFFSIIFLSAALCGIVFSFLNKKQKFKPTKKNILWGILLGVPNYFSLKFFFAALQELDTSIAFLVLNIGIILLSTLVGFLFYQEKLSPKNMFGIFLAILSLYLIFI